jgi:hypothetical protein
MHLPFLSHQIISCLGDNQRCPFQNQDLSIGWCVVVAVPDYGPVFLLQKRKAYSKFETQYVIQGKTIQMKEPVPEQLRSNDLGLIKDINGICWNSTMLLLI